MFKLVLELVRFLRFEKVDIEHKLTETIDFLVREVLTRVNFSGFLDFAAALCCRTAKREIIVGWVRSPNDYGLTMRIAMRVDIGCPPPGRTRWC